MLIVTCTHQLTANTDASLLIPNDTSAVIIVIVCVFGYYRSC